MTLERVPALDRLRPYGEIWKGGSFPTLLQDGHMFTMKGVYIAPPEEAPVLAAEPDAEAAGAGAPRSQPPLPPNGFPPEAQKFVDLPDSSLRALVADVYGEQWNGREAAIAFLLGKQPR